MRTSRLPGVLAFAVLIVAIVAPAGRQEQDLARRAARALAQSSGEMTLSGLDQPVEVIRDRWGVPHIYAKTVHDLFFAQGFVAAQDRLWQLDLWRRIAEGRLSELLGPAGLTRDTFARLLKYRGDLDAELRSYGPDSRRIIEAFVAGINAQIALVSADEGRLPIEFQLTASRPGPWTVETVIGRMAGYIMTRNARSEVQRARLLRAVGPERAARLVALDPPAPLIVPDGLDLGDISDEILRLTAGAGETVDLSPLLREGVDGPAEGLLPLSARSPGAVATRPPAPRASGTDGVDFGAAEHLSEVGSNNWVVAGAHSASGRPLLANDPHRAIMLPSLRYTVHLNGPGWNVIGAGEPALPGVAAGHNDRVAFGFTIVGIDQQDLYVERLDPSNHDRYLYRGEWHPMRIEHERVVVRDEEPRAIELRFTRHGPVLHIDPARHRAYVLRWVGVEPGSAGYLRSLALDTARDWPEFLRAVEGWKVPSENLVYADVDGNIGWVAAGLAPIRPGWNGLLPVPGHEGAYEWAGFLRLADLPQLANPASGVIATANHNILPPRYDRALGYEFGAPFRFARIMEVLLADQSGRRRLTASDFETLQHDALSVGARALVAGVRLVVPGPDGVPARHPASWMTDDARKAAALLARWDAVLSKDSPAAALYELWLPRIQRAFADRFLPEADRAHVGGRLPIDQILDLVGEAHDGAPVSAYMASWVDGSARPGVQAPRSNRQDGAGPGAGALSARGRQAAETSTSERRGLVLEALTSAALDEAWREAVERMGADPAAWAWGRLHRARFEHPLANTPERRALMDLGDVPRGGDGTTPFATGSSFRQTSGASFREVIDLADWDRSTMTNVPGQSGQPGSPHYGDLLPLWAEGRYHPMLFSRQAVERNAAARLILLPAVKPSRDATSRDR